MYCEVDTMIISKHGKCILLSLLITSTLASDVSAETIVHTERTHKQASVAQDKVSEHRNVNTGQTEPPIKSPAQNVSDNTTLAVEDDTPAKENADNTIPNSGSDIRLATSTESAPIANPTGDDKKANSSKQKNFRYIEGFKIKGPVIVTQSQEGVFLYTSKLYEGHEQYGDFTLLMQKARSTATLGPSYISTLFSCKWSIDFDALINKNHKPRFILITNDGTEKIIELNMYSYNAEAFLVISPKWGTLLQNAHKLYLELSSQSGDNVRLPIPADAVEQWITVANADMKKVKKEFENK